VPPISAAIPSALPGPPASAARRDGPALAVRDLRFAYGRREVLDGVDLEVAAGERVGLLGPNGSGKSTLMAIATGLLRPAGGEVGRPPGATAAGVVFQSPALDPWQAVRANLVDAGRFQGLGRRDAAARADRLLDRLGLAERSRDRVGVLSGGLARRVDLARALLHEPDLLLLDEPTTGLDPAARADFLDLLDELAAERTLAVLLTTHLVDEADRCDRVVLLDRGRIVAEGPPEALRRELGPRRLVVSGEVPDGGDWTRVPGGWSTPFPAEADPAVLRTLVAEGRSITVAPPTLADVFAVRTGRRLDEAAAPAGTPRGRRGGGRR